VKLYATLYNTLFGNSVVVHVGTTTAGLNSLSVLKPKLVYLLATITYRMKSSEGTGSVSVRILDWLMRLEEAKSILDFLG